MRASFHPRSEQPFGSSLAYIHDAGFGDFARRSSPAVINILRNAGISGGLVIELGCGSGLLARRLVNAGYDVLGVDISPHMIAIARRRVSEADFEVASFLDFDFPPCAAVISLGECFNYLFDARNSRSSLRQLFRRVYRALHPGGFLIFDISGPGRARDFARRFWTGRDWACLVEYLHNVRSAHLIRRITTFQKLRGLYRRAEETHVQKLYRGSQLATDLRDIGFRVRIVRGYGRFRFQKAHVALIAKKPLNGPTS